MFVFTKFSFVCIQNCLYLSTVKWNRDKICTQIRHLEAEKNGKVVKRCFLEVEDNGEQYKPDANTCITLFLYQNNEYLPNISKNLHKVWTDIDNYKVYFNISIDNMTKNILDYFLISWFIISNFKNRCSRNIMYAYLL